MTGEPLVEAAGIAKTFLHRKHRAGFGGLLRALFGVGTPAGFSALRSVDLRINRGDAVAVLGENGAGKSTLLKIISGVLLPSAGELRVTGRVAAQLELGAGFHPEFTGLQNLQAAAGLAGVPPDDIASLIPEIVAFAEMEEDIDRPLKHYSSGMVVRLGFALTAALKPDLLISDEVLAVGDESFQKKCIRWLEDFLGGGGTLLLVSHSTYHVQKLCRRALWLHRGSVLEEGDVFRVCQSYLAYHDHKLRGSPMAENSGRRAIHLRVNSRQDDDPWPEINQGGELQIELNAEPDPAIDSVRLQLSRSDGSLLTEQTVAPDVRMNWQQLPLLPGQYLLQADPLDGQEQRCGEPERVLIRVTGEAREFGSIVLPRDWGAISHG